jgi:N-acetylneuraminate synthase
LARGDGGPDSSFSLEPPEFAALIEGVRTAEQALGAVRYGPAGAEVASLAFRRSLFVVEEVAAGETLSERTVRSIRPGDGLPPSELSAVLGRRAKRRIARGTPLSWDLVE